MTHDVAHRAVQRSQRWALRSIATALYLATATVAAADTAPSRGDALYVIPSYSPERDPAADLRAAVARADAENKRILLVVGGDWCVWCEIFDIFLARDAEVRAAMAESFLTLKINMSDENPNDAFLSRYPTPTGYPDFIILESDGRYLASQDSAALERGRTYDPHRMIAFARAWRRS